MPKNHTCAGCGKPCSTRHHITFAPGHDGYVCDGRSYHYPSRGCVLKARQKLELCPGCGKSAADLGTLCYDCTTTLDFGKAQEARKLEWWTVFPYQLAPEWGNREGNYGPYDIIKLGKLLADCFTAGRTELHLGNGTKHTANTAEDHHIPARGDYADYYKVEVELTAEQGAALKRLTAELRHMFRLQYQAGFRAGDNALKRLSSGETNIRDYNDLQKKAEAFEPAASPNDNPEEKE
jgi:hypothetical protein